MFKRKGRAKDRDAQGASDSPYAPSAYAPSAYAPSAYAPSAYGHASQHRREELTISDYANGIPNIKIKSMFWVLIRQLLWVIPLFIVGFVVIWIMTADIKRTYTGEGTIMVQIGDEYVYQPVAGTQGQSSLLQTPDTITLNEVAMIKNAEVIDRVIGEISLQPGGLAAFAPSIARKLASNPKGSIAYQLDYMELRKMVGDSFKVEPRPKSSIIDMSFEHEDPQVAVDTLNALMDAYMSYRRTIFVEGAGELITERRKDTEEQLKANEQRMVQFLAGNNISDFTSEQAGASVRTENLRATLNTLRAQIVTAERSLASLEDQIRDTPDQINLYVDDRASNRIAQAELELKQLLAKYLPNSDPVRAKQLEIQEMQSLLMSNNGRATGGRRVGPNPVYQDLMRTRNNAQASADSLRESEITVQRQLNSADAKLRRMTALVPAYSSLLREQDTLNNRLRTYLNKEQEAIINQQQSESSSENVRVIASATYPLKGANMRLLLALAGAVLWGGLLALVALFRTFSNPKLYRVPAALPADYGYQSHVQPQAQAQLREATVYHDPIPEGIQARPEPISPRRGNEPHEYVPSAADLAEFARMDQPGPEYVDWSAEAQYGRPTADGTLAAPLSAPLSGFGGGPTTPKNPYA